MSSQPAVSDASAPPKSSGDPPEAPTSDPPITPRGLFSRARPEPSAELPFARRGIARWFSRVKVTREGKYFIGATVGVGLAAVGTGNNLLFLLVGMLVSLIAVSSVLSWLSLRSLTVVRRLPTRAQAQRPHLVEIEVFNHKGRMPSYAIEVEDLRAGQPADKRCFFLKVSPRSAQVAAYRRTPARRGRDRHVGFRIATRFPFGLIEKSREILADGELIIYPAVDPVLLPQDVLGTRARGSSSLGRGVGDEVLGVRPMREGDDPRDIYWRKSTHPEHLVLRERGRETQREVTFKLESTFSMHSGPSEEWTARFERRIRDIASRAVAHLKRGDGVTVLTSHGERARSNAAMGADPLLRFLALLEPQPERRRNP